VFAERVGYFPQSIGFFHSFALNVAEGHISTYSVFVGLNGDS
jgi:hypothetical protein